MRHWQLAEDALVSFLPRGAHHGSTWFGRLGDVVQQPPVWAGVAAALALGGGDRGRRAAVRGGVCYCTTAVVANLILKPLVGRDRPPGAGHRRTGPVTSSFPSGHAATDLAFTLGASQELPLVFIALAPATVAAHWSLVRSRGHYPSDVFFGGLLAVAVVMVAWKLSPPGGPSRHEEHSAAPCAQPQEGPEPVWRTAPGLDVVLPKDCTPTPGDGATAARQKNILRKFPSRAALRDRR